MHHYTNSAWLLWLLFTFVSSYSETGHVDDKPLLLTPLIRAGRIKEARAASYVKPLKGTAESYSGFLTVDEAHDSNLFFWFFPAASGRANAPLLLWLQGGPGASSLIGVFNEHGPFAVCHCESDGLRLRDVAWTDTYSILYVDNPVGAGFSYTGDDYGYSRNQTDVSRNLYSALMQFFELFHEYQHNDFYVSGESYAGKFIVSVSYAIHQYNPEAKVKINLKGLFIGNGMVDPRTQLAYSEYLYQHGFFDEYGKHLFEKVDSTLHDQISRGDYRGALRTNEESFTGILYPYPTLFQNLTGIIYYYNMLVDRRPTRYDDWMKFVQKPSIRAALHVGQRPLNRMEGVIEIMSDDLMRSVAPYLETLLDTGRYRVLLYNGQLDIRFHYRGTMRMAQSLEWSGAKQFRYADRTIWRVRDRKNLCNNGNETTTTTVAGYVTSSGPLTVVMVRNSGHLVVSDQPSWAFDLINRFTTGKMF